MSLKKHDYQEQFRVARISPDVQRLCDEFDIRIVPGHVYPQPGQTRAPVTIGRIIERYGEAHARLVMATLAETEGNAGLIDETSLWAVSDLVRACPRWVEDRTSDWLEAWDHIPLGPLMFLVQELRGSVRQRSALAGLCYFELRSILDPEEGLTGRKPKEHQARGLVAPIAA